MKMKKLFRFVLCRCSVAVAFGLMGLTAAAQTSEVPEETVSTGNNLTGGRLSMGGYGEVAYSRNFYSDNQYRYRNPDTYKNDPSNGRFDIPHAVIYINYDFAHTVFTCRRGNFGRAVLGNRYGLSLFGLSRVYIDNYACLTRHVVSAVCGNVLRTARNNVIGGYRVNGYL